jgi:uncharacterized Ntn-hydrolase superfamily protein
MISPLSTFSIVAYDAAQSAWGIAVASKFPAVGAVVPWARAACGAVATQSYANTTFGPRGLELMGAGHPAHDVLAMMLSEDADSERRQVGMVDARGNAATFTGEACLDWAGGKTGEHFAVQGNILASPQVVEDMASAFLRCGRDLPERLVTALLAGDQAGGDRRGRQSAALLVVKAEAGYGGFNDRWIDYRVDDDPDPVPKLAELLELHRLHFGHSPEQDRLAIKGQIARQLQTMMRRLGYYSHAIDGEYGGTTRQALIAFIGNENFEERTDFEKGTIDRPVYEYLMRKFGGAQDATPTTKVP